MIDPMIAGRVLPLYASLPKSLARVLSLFLTHSLGLLGFFGGVLTPPLPPPVNSIMDVESMRPILVRKDVIVRPSSLKSSLIFLSHKSSSKIFLAVFR